MNTIKIFGLMLIGLLWFVPQPQAATAGVVYKCFTLMAATGQTASTNGTIMELPEEPNRLKGLYFTGASTATNNSGTTPTLDVKIQTCRTSSSSTCADTPIVFDQCTTGACYGGDSLQYVDINSSTVNVFTNFRAVTTLAGTNPNYDVTVRLCYSGF